MSKALIPIGKNLGYTDIYLDFVLGDKTATRLFKNHELDAVVAQLENSVCDRAFMADRLTAQNRLYQVAEKTFENIERLKDPRAVCVFAGQQAGLFGGPMFTVIKAIGIVKAAKIYEKQLGRPVIPIFWIAGDDHDFEEANHLTLLDQSTEICTITYPTSPDASISVGNITFSDQKALARAIEAYKNCLGETEFTPDLYDLLEDSYTSSADFVSAFGRFMAGLFRDSGLVFFCPLDDSVKRHAAPFFEAILDRQIQIHDLIAKTNREITSAGYHIQVEKKENATHLFYDLEGRQPILHSGENFTVGQTAFSRAELDEALREHPERFSPDVILRPVLQSYLFPTLSQKGGPSEIAYLAQVNPLFELFDLPAPVCKARPTVTVVESRHEKLMTMWGVSFEELTDDIEKVVNRILTETFPADLEKHFAELKDGVEEHFDRFIQESLGFDPSLKETARQAHGKIDFNLKAFEQKVFAAHKKKSKDTRERIYRLWRSLYPDRGFQERNINIGCFVAKYGFGFIDFLFDQMDAEEPAHQLINLSEMTRL